MLRKFFACLALGAAMPAHAAGLFWAVDDAAVVERCHVESWVEAPRRGPEVWTVAPACIDRRGIEWAIAGSFDVSDGIAGDAFAVGAKAVLTHGETWALALALNAGDVRIGGIRGWGVNAPFTVFAGPDFAVSLNVGWEDDADDSVVWGAGVDFGIAVDWHALAEVRNREAQAGVRWLAPFGSVDGAFGRERRGGSGVSRVSLGMVIEF